MATAIYGPDGVLRSSYTFSSTLSSHFFSGLVDSDSVEVQVSIRGGAWTSNPDFVVFEGQDFTVPNPVAYPNGLKMYQGQNTVEVRSILSNGAVTPSAKITAYVLSEDDITARLEAPSGVYLERYSDRVRISIDALSAPEIRGYHIYASAESGGGRTGYSRVNINPVVATETYEVTSQIGTLTTDVATVTENDGSPKTPLYLDLLGTQKDQDDVVVGSYFHESIEVTPDVSQLRTVVNVSSVKNQTRYIFNHDRFGAYNTKYPCIPNAAFTSIPQTDPLFYVVTAIYYVDGVEYESSYSQELRGSSLSLTTNTTVIPSISRQKVLEDATISIYRSQPQLDLKPGSVIRDTFLDPFSSEVERVGFLMDFVQRASSFSTLLQIDDPDLSGSSIPVQLSAYKRALKQALFLTSDETTQVVIDNAFEKLAANFGVSRGPGRKARVELLFSTKTTPTTAINYGIGTVIIIAGKRYRLTSNVSIAPAGAGSVFDPKTGRYSTTAFAQAEQPGQSYSVAPNIMGVIEGGPRSIEVRTISTIPGMDYDSNASLALSAQNKLASVDTGTKQGLYQTVVSVPGVSQVTVVPAGHPLMMRDLKDGEHTGGKVDIWLRGETIATITDTFAFPFDIVKGIQFEPYGNLSELKFKAIDSKLSPDNPIIEMLDDQVSGYYFRNETTQTAFDLTDCQIVAYNIVQLSSQYNSPVSYTDILRGAYRYRLSKEYAPSQQPVTDVTSLTGEVTGNVVAYQLIRKSDPLDLGQSVQAGDVVQVLSTANVPSSTPIVVTNESHVILDDVEYLNRLGANPLSVKVYSQDKTIQYNSPYMSSTPDFTFVAGDITTPLGIKRTQTSSFATGDSLVIDYTYDENFSLSYRVNALVGIAQNAVDEMKHLTADILCKESVAMPVTLGCTVVLQNKDRRYVDSGAMRSVCYTALQRLFDGLRQGESLHAGDVITALNSLDGVSYVVTPLTQMSLSIGTRITRELVTTDVATVTEITSWALGNKRVWILENPLRWDTTSAGGPTTEYRGVFQDDVQMYHHETTPNINGSNLKGGPVYAAYIIGKDGLLIPGYSDDATLNSQYTFASNADRVAKRIEITQNRVLVVVDKDDSPAAHTYTVSYIVGDTTKSQSIDPGAVGYLTLGTVTFVLDQERSL